MISCSTLLVSTNLSGLEIENKGLKSDFSGDRQLAEKEDSCPAGVSWAGLATAPAPHYSPWCPRPGHSTTPLPPSSQSNMAGWRLRAACLAPRYLRTTATGCCTNPHQHRLLAQHSRPQQHKHKKLLLKSSLSATGFFQIFLKVVSLLASGQS